MHLGGLDKNIICLCILQAFEYFQDIWLLGAIQVLRNVDGGGGCPIFWKKALRRCNVQCY